MTFDGDAIRWGIKQFVTAAIGVFIAAGFSLSVELQAAIVVLALAGLDMALLIVKKGQIDGSPPDLTPPTN